MKSEKQIRKKMKSMDALAAKHYKLAKKTKNRWAKGQHLQYMGMLDGSASALEWVLKK